MGVRNALHNRPVRVVGFLTAAHSFIVGIGYLIKIGGTSDSLLYGFFATDPIRMAFGITLLLTGAFLMFAFTRNNPKTIRVASFWQSFAWGFATFTYALHGAILLGLTIFLLPTLVSTYLAYAHGNRVSIMAYDRTPQAREDTANEDQL